MIRERWFMEMPGAEQVHESGNGDIPTSNIHIQDVSVITLNEKRFTVKLTETSSTILPLHVLF